MTADFGNLLQEWPYDPGQNVRILQLTDRRSVLQIRVDQGGFQGILQMYLDGRPDGQRPHGRAFSLEHHKERLETHREQTGSENGFTLSSESCEELFDESSRIYERYVFLLQLHDYRRVVRDTERNMGLFRFVHRYAESEADRNNLERWWPYVLRINAEARALLAADDHAFDLSIKIVEGALRDIRGLKEVDAPEFGQEKARALELLGALKDKMAAKRPPTLRESLETQLQQAVEKEEFETAAVLRDRLRRLVDR